MHGGVANGLLCCVIVGLLSAVSQFPQHDFMDVPCDSCGHRDLWSFEITALLSKAIGPFTRAQWRIQDLAKGGANLPKRAPQAVMAPSRFEGHRGPFEASDAQRAHYELRRPLRAAQRASSDAQRDPF